MSNEKEEQKEVDWLEGDIEQKRAEQHAQAVEFAKTYEIFVDTPRGQELLRVWEESILNLSTPIDSSVQKYAADEAVRDFIRGIKRQIKLAQERVQ